MGPQGPAVANDAENRHGPPGAKKIRRKSAPACQSRDPRRVIIDPGADRALQHPPAQLRPCGDRINLRRFGLDPPASQRSPWHDGEPAATPAVAGPSPSTISPSTIEPPQYDTSQVS
ncbi:MAG: hypothetical protein J0G37_01640 [Afipia sp.]|nr:hypothetical protein [Afipia sp.]